MTEQERLAEINRRMREANRTRALVEHHAGQATALMPYPDADAADRCACHMVAAMAYQQAHDEQLEALGDHIRATEDER